MLHLLTNQGEPEGQSAQENKTVNLHVSDIEAGIKPEQKAQAYLAETTELPETGESNFLLIISNSNNNNKHTMGRNNLAKNVTHQFESNLI